MGLFEPIPRQIRDIDAQLRELRTRQAKSCQVMGELLVAYLAEQAEIERARDALLELRHLTRTRLGPLGR